MKKDVTIYHNPRCSKSRQTLELLREQGVEPTIVDYQKEPLAAVQIERLIDLLGIEPHALLRAKEPAYKELGLSPGSTRKQIVQAIAAHPVLLERPVVVCGGRAALGRPPEAVKEIL